MSLSKLPSGRWRARCWDPAQHKSVPAASLLGLPKGTTWPTRREAKKAREKARERLYGMVSSDITVGQWWERWTTDPLFSRPKESTNRHNRERTRGFAERYKGLRLGLVSRQLVRQEWLAGGQRYGTVPALRAMFSDAVREELVTVNPFAGLGLSRGTGNRDVRPPSEDVVRALIAAAYRLSGPGFGAWLQVAAFTGMRPGELDALRWDAVDFERSRIRVLEQWSGSGFSLPKNGRRRDAPLTAPAREALMSAPRQSEFCFTNLRGQHWTASGRAYHWKAVRAAVGFEGSLYLATRHFAGSWMVNELGLVSEDVAIALGHTDGGNLVRVLYGHRDEHRALDRVIGAYDGRSNVRELKAVKDV